MVVMTMWLPRQACSQAGTAAHAFLGDAGWSQPVAYLGVAAVACLGYGSVFLLAGLLFANPIVPATGMLLWESVNLFVPAALKKLSLIYYLQSLCPVAPPPDATLPPALVVLISPAEPIGTGPALLVVGGLSAALRDDGFGAADVDDLRLSHHSTPGRPSWPASSALGSSAPLARSASAV